ncbi:hypothetical protein ABW19_dt0206274 [Dactylella cylindrospora]|nr:hypothetical protein ABW19_dt0206274 [Dactylella cylindrospora]
MRLATTLSVVASIIPFLSLLAFAKDPYVYFYRNNNAHIAYKGDVSVTWENTGRAGQACTFELGPQNHSWFYVGVHPSWDPNPYFFEVNHAASVSCSITGDNCVDIDEAEGSFFTWTTDEIYNLNYYSSAFVLDSSRGRYGVYEPQRTVDFEEATYTKTRLDGERGYRIELGDSSWSTNHTDAPEMTLDNRIEAYEQEYDINGCFLNPRTRVNLVPFEWTGIHDSFSIDFTFTNEKAVATFNLKFNDTDMTLRFEGTRNSTTVTNEYWGYPDINLVDFDEDMPKFEWVTGGEIDFENPPGASTSTTSRRTFTTPTSTEESPDEPTSAPAPTATDDEEPTPTDSDTTGTLTSNPTDGTPEPATSTGEGAPSSTSALPGSSSFLRVDFGIVYGAVVAAALGCLFL